jgi:hypothetical protein
MNLFLLNVKAQVDGVASPTIPFNPPGNVTPSVGPSSTVVGPNVSLKTDKPKLQVGEKTVIQVVIDTQLKPISQYSIQILFSPDYLKVADFDPTTNTIEVDYRDTFFDATINEVSQQQGIISITAENPVGSSSITNRVVAQFEVEALKVGFAELNFGEENTMLVNSSSEDILVSTNTVDLIIAGESEVTTTPSTSTTPNTSVLPTSDVPLPSSTPDTALPDGLRSPLILTMGLVLVALGGYLYRLRGSNAYKKN